MPTHIEIRQAHFPDERQTIRTLFQEYAGSLDFELCFQNFQQELDQLPGNYQPPSGRLLVALVNHQPAGCVALRKLDEDTCEMKRMYVSPKFRGLQLGRKLALELLQQARDANYKAMRLDTIGPAMQPAIKLYRSLGFRSIAPYYANPIPGAEYLELEL